ncbi:hypothetical protein C6I20_07825 [Aeromicrobium sp. A1-2]|uniref:hypothetical protein n=1 Tax=Aeromicrobium sp. A1-2 TaxID=2107713 RepID=UPI000E4DDF8E|nr:hypothetical protein [Aeromicrobium sp. A1-2]AXT85100.1 hypothetical protein C6I20_07825 [Aeromicrobium sp. A1-2]
MYGDNTAQLRDALTSLMQLGRNSRGSDDLPADAIQLVGSFRHSITVWCQHGVRASNPSTELGETTPRTRGPAEELRVRLAEARVGYTAPLPTVEQLATPHPHHVVDLWRQAARGAALGEHDFPAGLSYGDVTDDQAMTVLKDAAETTRALTGLDRRYATAVSGWEPIVEVNLLGRAAVVCAAHAGYGEPDYAVDRRGWRPPVRLADGPTLPLLGGVLQAENNLLVRLGYQPDGHSLRLILDSQRIVSHHASNLAQAVSGGGELAARWVERAETYTLLVDQTRNLRGLVGHGVAAAQGALAAARVQNLSPNTPIEARALRHLDALFTHIDRRIADTIAAGADDRSYLMRIGIPRADLSAGGAVKQQRSRHIPLEVPPGAPVLDTAKTRLRPEPAEPHVPVGSAQSRASFTRSIDPSQRQTLHPLSELSL